MDKIPERKSNEAMDVDSASILSELVPANTPEPHLIDLEIEGENTKPTESADTPILNKAEETSCNEKSNPSDTPNCLKKSIVKVCIYCLFYF